MEEEKKKRSDINFTAVAARIKAKKWLFVKVWLITFALSCLWILPQPRYYVSEVSVAPESSSHEGAGGLASLASSFGVNIGNASTDAIYPQLYPDLFSSTEFLVGLMDIKIKTIDGELDTDYYDYLKNHQKQNFLTVPFKMLKNWVNSLMSKEPEADIPGKDGKRFDPFRLSESTSKVIEKASSNITCTYSRTTDVVTITVKDQDPMVSALLADSIKEHLQVFITDYRTKKSRIDYEFYKKLTADAKSDYEKARQLYGSFADANMDIVLESYRAKRDDLENDMQLKYNTYSTLKTQLQTAIAKVQENTPAFTTLTNATVPVKPAGPKRMIFVAVMMFLATIGTIAYLFRKELIKWF
ncbi:MAG: chain-length determining protein [Prevotella sp.]|nr:chain-length determining protein [Prevotella sp.]